MYSRDEPFLRSLECYFGIYLFYFDYLFIIIYLIIYFNKHQNNPLVSAETIRHSSTYIILYLL